MICIKVILKDISFKNILEGRRIWFGGYIVRGNVVRKDLSIRYI